MREVIKKFFHIKKNLTVNKGNNDAFEFKFFHKWVDQEYIPLGDGEEESHSSEKLREHSSAQDQSKRRTIPSQIVRK